MNTVYKIGKIIQCFFHILALALLLITQCALIYGLLSILNTFIFATRYESWLIYFAWVLCSMLILNLCLAICMEPLHILQYLVVSRKKRWYQEEKELFHLKHQLYKASLSLPLDPSKYKGFPRLVEYIRQGETLFHFSNYELLHIHRHLSTSPHEFFLITEYGKAPRELQVLASETASYIRQLLEYETEKAQGLFPWKYKEGCLGRFPTVREGGKKR